ncbi:MAG: NAD(P)/FAD-dependent oxidoreductase [Anaerolineae bacterium]
MKKLRYDVVVIGSGPAGLASALAAHRFGARALILERNEEPGGILQQCIHNGFGLKIFGQDLTGPEYAANFIEEAEAAGVDFLLDTMVLEICLVPGARHLLYATNGRDGLLEIEAGAIVLAMGCRERTRGALGIPGDRPAGIFTAGTAQRLVNIEGYMPGRRFVILGSGDIGMIMARRLTWEGAEVLAVLEIKPYLGGLVRNYVQCLRDWDIPLYLSHTISAIRGRKRLEAVRIVKVDEKMRPIPGTEREIACDALLLSVGLIPENELSRRAGIAIDPLTGGPYVCESLETDRPGIFAAGNVVHVYDLADEVSRAGEVAGREAARYALGERKLEGREIMVRAGEGIRYVVPQRLRPAALDEGLGRLELRVTEPVEEKVTLLLEADGRVVMEFSRRYVRPGEMVTLSLPMDMVALLEGARELKVKLER